MATTTWQALPVPEGSRYAWDAAITYVQEPPFFQQLPAEPAATQGCRRARVLAVLGDSVTTDHISPAGAIPKNGPAREVPAGTRRANRWTGTPSAPAAAITR